jgi:hypothetical protein
VTPVSRQWPPLIVAAHQPLRMRLRDVAITCLAWLAIVLLLNREVELGLTSYLKDWGLGTLVDRLQLADLGDSLGWYESFAHLYPYLTVVSVLLVFLCGFGIHTLLRQRRALRAPHPRTLSLAREARDAALAHTPSNTGDLVGLGRDEIVSGPDLLAMLNAQDRAALVDVRRLRIAMVEVNSAGHYRIVDGTALLANALGRLQAG